MNDIKTDCFAYKYGCCSALKFLVCKDSTCNFYKSKSEFAQEIDELYEIDDVSEYLDKLYREDI